MRPAAFDWVRRGLATLLLIAPLARGQAAQAENAPALPPAKLHAIDAAISSEMSRSSIPGLSVAVVLDNQLRWTNGYGLADIENYVPAKDETSYRLASLTKPITAVAAMLLVERGQLDLDVPIQKYVPSFPEKQWPVTTRQLLAHQSGIRHHTDPEWTNTRHFPSPTESLQVFKDSPLTFEPGTKTLYTSNGYTLVGCAVEGIAEMSYPDFVRANVFEPAGMERTQLDDLFEIIPNRSAGYTKDSAGKLRNSPLADTSNRIPGGGLCGTAPDMARFAIAFLGGNLVRKETVAWMLTRQKTHDGKPTGYGLGWIIGERQGKRECWHTGGQPRVSGTLYMRPDAKLAVVILANLEGVSNDLNQLARKVADILQSK